ncbi:hypothetical protein LN042_28595 [Kitasatospora sp. RB6PN24]|uniref:hypothetical protein n=1 Tax=Kitasatospora humi TaxID=2893891 RepID=UPI001E5C498F|nr:hypothetical protein [Kitasatospora humi]MCC9310982.1 hypothetical protein [Kitasatospora humi]
MVLQSTFRGGAGRALEYGAALWLTTGVSLLLSFLDSSHPVPAALLVLGAGTGLLVTAVRLRIPIPTRAASPIEAAAALPLALCLVLAQVICWWGGTQPVGVVRAWAAATALAMALLGVGRAWVGATSAACAAGAQAGLALTIAVTGTVPAAAALPSTAVGLTCCVFAALTALTA